jgi:hypothetical protein
MPILTVPLNTASHFPARPPGPAIADDRARERQHFQTSFFPPGYKAAPHPAVRAGRPVLTNLTHLLTSYLTGGRNETR